MIIDLNRITGRLRKYQKVAKYPNAHNDFNRVYEKIDSLMDDIETIINKNK